MSFRLRLKLEPGEWPAEELRDSKEWVGADAAVVVTLTHEPGAHALGVTSMDGATAGPVELAELFMAWRALTGHLVGRAKGLSPQLQRVLRYAEEKTDEVLEKNLRRKAELEAAKAKEGKS